MSKVSGNAGASDNEESYADGSALTVLLGSGAKVKILVALLSEVSQDFNVTDIARLAGVSRNTVYSHLDGLVSVGVVEESRKIGDSHMYKINQESEVAKGLAEMEWNLMDAMFE
jgi:predicted transcriptional regulator